MLEIFHHERGIPSKRKSSTCIDYVPALCTHRPSLLPIGCCGELSGGRASAWPEVLRAPASRGRRSRNKVSVGEPAEGSLYLVSCPLFGGEWRTHNNDNVVVCPWPLRKRLAGGSTSKEEAQERSTGGEGVELSVPERPFGGAHSEGGALCGAARQQRRHHKRG